MASLKQKTINSMFWSVSDRLGIQTLLAVTSIIMARLLRVSDFGLFGMLAIFNAVGQTMIDSGFGSALINKQELSEADKSSIFMFNLFISMIISFILILFAPVIADFYSQPELIPITRVISSGLVIIALSLVQTSLFTKDLQFKLLMKINLAAVITSSLIGVGMAFRGFGVWSLVGQMMSRYLAYTVLAWLFSTWRPSLIFSFESLKSMFPFGSRLLVSGLLSTIFSNIYPTIIGRLFSPVDLGYYSKASMLETTATKSTGTSLTNVTFSAFSPYQNNPKILKQAYQKTIKLAHFIHFPIMVGLILLSEPIIRLLLTDRWLPSVPYFQLLCIAGMVHPLQLFNLNILKVRGKTDIFLRLQILKKILTVIVIFITYRYGIMSLIIGQIIISVCSFYLNSLFSNKLIDYGIIQQLRDISPSLLTALFMGMIVFISRSLVLSNYVLNMLFQIIIGLSTYLVLSLVTQPSEFKEIGKTFLNIFAEIFGNK
jgi:O-antigen/teichoic acid export membrane protein